LKGPETIVASPTHAVVVRGGNAGLTKGGTGDTQSGITVALLAKNEPFLAATAAAYLIKKSADEIHERVGVYFNATDVSEEIPRVLASLTH
jgi:NAD(P)H-hydrate epimerase